MRLVLIVAASPLDQDRLSLNREIKKIKQALERSKNRELWQIESNEAATVEDLRRALLDHNPTILHFSGHGGGSEGLCFEDDQGSTHTAQASALARLLHHFKEKLQCVVLNACYSTVQAEAIRQEISYVVGMRSAIDDDSAAKFAVSFYDAIFAGTNFRVAFDLGCTAIDLQNLPGSDVPTFLVGSQKGGGGLTYTEDIPEIENVILAYWNTSYDSRYQLTTKGSLLTEAIERYYRDDGPVSATKVTVNSKQKLDNLHWKVEVQIDTNEGWKVQSYYLRINHLDVKIEWEASVGLCSTPIKTYLALGAQEPMVARVHAEISNYYNFSFRDKRASHQSVSLRTIEQESFQGYVARNSPSYAELMKIILDGKSHEIALAVINVDDHPNCSLITELLSDTWIIPS
jgi:hypothetical protein